MAIEFDKMTAEIDELLDAVSYEVTSARAAGLSRPEELRTALKRARDLLTDADSIASHVAVARNES